MTVKELIEKLKEMPEDAEVVIGRYFIEAGTETYYSINKADKKRAYYIKDATNKTGKVVVIR